MKTIYFVLVFFVLSTLLYSTIINIPADQPTIQAGIDATVNADTVLVQPGIYVENINYNGKNITVASLFLTTQDTTFISQTIIDGDSLNSVVIIENGEDSTAVLCGFTITNGLGGGEYPVWFAGGITCNNSSTPIIMNMRITGNYASYGGGISCYYSSPSLVNVTLTDNSAGYTGGGIYCFNSNPSLVNLTITGNSAVSSGGGIFCSHSNPSLVNVAITGNSANASGGGISCYYSSPSLVNVMISENFNASSGGGIYSANSSLSFESVVIKGNIANFGGGIFSSESSTNLQNLTITGNFASYGGGISCMLSSPSIINATITGNIAYCGCGIYCYYNSNPDLINCILWNDSPQEIYFGENYASNSITISYSDIQGGEEGIVTNNNGTVNWLDGNIDEDPLFVDPLNGDFHLTENSPCIDAGDPNFPLDPDNTICDMGAFYYQQDQYIIVEEIYPQPGSLTISEGDSINFYISASDPDGNTIEYNWELEGAIVSTDSFYTFYTDENSTGTYEVTLDITDNYQPPSRNTLNFEWDVVVEDISTSQELLPIATAIYQNYPNPFNPTTTINYSLKEDSKVSLNIYNIKGQKVKQLVSDQLSAGQHSAIWNGKDDNGKSVSSGIYFYKLKTENYEKTKRMVLLK